MILPDLNGRPTVVESQESRRPGWRTRVSALGSNPAARGAAAIAGGASIAQAASLLAAPVLTRLYSPEAFGVFALVFSLVSVIASVASLRLELAIPLPTRDSDAAALVRLALWSSFAVSLIVASAIAVAGGWFDDRSDLELMPWLWFAPALTFATSVFLVLSQAVVRLKDYKAVARRNVTGQLGTVGGQILLGATGNAGGLLAGQLVGRAVATWGLLRSTRPLMRSGGQGTLRDQLRSYWRYPALFAPSALLNTLGTQLPLILVGVYWGVQSAGYLGLAQRLLLLPAALVAGPVSQVFIAEIAERVRSGQTRNRSAYLRTSAHLAVLAAPFVVAVMALAPFLTPLILGSEWAVAGQMCQAMALSVGLGVVVSPTSSIFGVYQTGRLNLLLDVLRVVLVAAAGWLAYSNAATATQSTWAMYGAQAVVYAAVWLAGLMVASGKRF